MKGLMVHGRGSIPATFEELAALPNPKVLGPLHQPIRHDEFISVMSAALKHAGYIQEHAEYAIQHKGLKLFGVVDLEHKRTKLPNVLHETGMMIGFRHGNDKSMAFRIVVGVRVFVCDNMAMAGELVLKGKHYKSFSLKDQMGYMVEKIGTEYAKLNLKLDHLRNSTLVDKDAKELIYTAFIKGEHDRTLPLRYLPSVDEWYFNPPIDAVDCQPRTLWGLHNAFTRTIKTMPTLPRQYKASIAVGRYFGLGE